MGFALEDEFNITNISYFLYKHRSRTFYEYGGGPSSFISINVGAAEVIQSAVLLLLDRADVDVIIRPRLAFGDGTYRFLSRDFPRLQWSTEDSPKQFFDNIDVLVVGQSSLGTEAQIAGIPVVSLYPLLHKHLELFLAPILESRRLQHYWWMHLFPQLHEFIDALQSGSIEVAPDMKSFRELTSSVFTVDTHVSKVTDPSERIADDIAEILDSSVLDTGVQNEYDAIRDKRFKLTKWPFHRVPLLKTVLLSSVDASSWLGRTLSYTLIVPLYWSFMSMFWIAFKLSLIDPTRYYFEFDRRTKKMYKRIFREHQM